nr:MAG TPA_asm: hypothetical protein [Caudoviricetes sp.]
MVLFFVCFRCPCCVYIVAYLCKYVNRECCTKFEGVFCLFCILAKV